MEDYLLERIKLHCNLTKTDLVNYIEQVILLPDEEIEDKITTDEKAFWMEWDNKNKELIGQILAVDMELMKLKRRKAA